jgi:hypothetical protein
MPDFTPAALRLMEAYEWPGNIRELQNCVERAVIVAKNGRVDVGDLSQDLHLPAAKGNAREADSIPPDLDAELERIERRFVLDALQKPQRRASLRSRRPALRAVSRRGLAIFLRLFREPGAKASNRLNWPRSAISRPSSWSSRSTRPRHRLRLGRHVPVSQRGRGRPRRALASPCREEQLDAACKGAGPPSRRAFISPCRTIAMSSAVFERIVSVGMFEHIGPRFYATFFETCRRC